MEKLLMKHEESDGEIDNVAGSVAGGEENEAAVDELYMPRPTRVRKRPQWLEDYECGVDSNE